MSANCATAEEPICLRLVCESNCLTRLTFERAQAYRRAHPRLALPDTFALTLAKSRRWLLLTGDGPLRALAAAEQVECHGVLWLIDLMHTERVVEAAILRAGLEQLARHPRCRLPRAEIDVRLVWLGEVAATGNGDS